MSFNYLKAFEVSSDGYLIENSILITGGDDSPVGNQAPLYSRYYRSNDEVWKKVGPNPEDWIITETGGGSAVVSPGYTWGRSGVANSGSWLLNDTVNSYLVGRNFPLYDGELLSISISNSLSSNAEIALYEHDKSTYTQLAVIALSSEYRKTQTYTGVSVTQGKELGIKIETGAVKDAVVQVLLKGSLTA